MTTTQTLSHKQVNATALETTDPATREAAARISTALGTLYSVRTALTLGKITQADVDLVLAHLNSH